MKPFLARSLVLCFAAGLTIAAPGSLRAQHGHLNAGALGINQGDPLIWANGADFTTSSGYVKTLDYTNAGPYTGYYQQNITLTALPATAAHAGPDPQASAPGSFLRARMKCLTAPPGGSFAFWENRATTPTIALGAGEAATNAWDLSESDGSPGSDPYGHIHGRRFTANRPGLYQIAFQAIDGSTNGAGGGPIHPPSAQLSIWFQAGISIHSIASKPEEKSVSLQFALPAATSWQIEANESLDSKGNWEPIGDPLPGNDSMVNQIISDQSSSRLFYRLRRIAP
jgi:hypothetical protein